MWEPLLHIMCRENMAGWLKGSENAQRMFECGVQFGLESDSLRVYLRRNGLHMNEYDPFRRGRCLYCPGVSDPNKSSSE